MECGASYVAFSAGTMSDDGILESIFRRAPNYFFDVMGPAKEMTVINWWAIWSHENCGMVEAVGFEPTSENLQPEAHTCLSPLLNLASSNASGKALESASPVFLILPSRAELEDQPDVWRPFGRSGADRETR